MRPRSTSCQLKITRAYAPHLWKVVLTGGVIFAVVFYGGIVLAVTRAFTGRSFVTIAFLLAVIFLMGAMKSHFRLRAVSQIIPDRRLLSWRTTLGHLTLWPLASLLYSCNALAAAFSRRITWRGITYELKSPDETVIIRRESGADFRV